MQKGLKEGKPKQRADAIPWFSDTTSLIAHAISINPKHQSQKL
jgi:hypothetical protein